MLSEIKSTLSATTDNKETSRQSQINILRSEKLYINFLSIEFTAVLAADRNCTETLRFEALGVDPSLIWEKKKTKPKVAMQDSDAKTVKSLTAYSELKVDTNKKWPHSLLLHPTPPFSS